ncbi:MAG: AIM24 family protein [Acidobacteriota bacterium]
MSSAQTGADFDEGVFLVHLNKGKDYLAKGELEEARQELEKARSLRPEENRVLNLLGMLYFKMELHQEAREIYGRLINLHPNEAVLHLNLGIIEFKENRLDAAEGYLKRAHELAPNGAKPHMYLGLLYNKRDDLERAAEHLTLAGATKLLEKVEQKRRQRAAARVDGSHLARGTANFRIQSQDKIDVDLTAVPTSPVNEPLGLEGGGLAAPDIDSILAGLSALGDAPPGIIPASSPPPGGSKPETVPPVPDPPQAEDEVEVILEEAPPREPPVSLKLDGLATPPPVPLETATILDLGAAPIPVARMGSKKFGPFRRPGAGLLEMEVNSQALLRPGRVTHYSGRLEFTRERGSGLIQVKGKGVVFLSEEQEQAILVELAGHSISVSSTHLLACSEGVRVEGSPLALGSGDTALKALRLVGHGCIALVVTGETICLDVEADQPAASDPRRVVAWSGDLRAEALASEILREVMTAGSQGVLSVHFEGKGTVLIEQQAAPLKSS